MRTSLPIAVLALLLSGCGEQTEPEAKTPPEPAANQPAVSAQSNNALPEGLVPAGEVKPSNMPIEKASAEADVPIYPGAKVDERAHGITEQPGEGQRKIAILLATTDDMEKVAGYYTKELKFQAADSDGSKMLMGKTPKGNDVIITLNPKEGGGTSILIKAIQYTK